MSSQPLIQLYDSVGLGLVLLWPTGVLYSNQTGGTSCLHPEAEGAYLPLVDELIDQEALLRQLFTGPRWRGACDSGIDEATAGEVERILVEIGAERPRRRAALPPPCAPDALDVPGEAVPSVFSCGRPVHLVSLMHEGLELPREWRRTFRDCLAEPIATAQVLRELARHGLGIAYRRCEARPTSHAELNGDPGRSPAVM